mmetsp:Transcript_81848/g.235171  ORF Transcript_81848/g.235171 Transcript_81848/m.235171 type:complete len:93 (+) Transcript_81848:103-381(+)
MRLRTRGGRATGSATVLRPMAEREVASRPPALAREVAKGAPGKDASSIGAEAMRLKTGRKPASTAGGAIAGAKSSRAVNACPTGPGDGVATW